MTVRSLVALLVASATVTLSVAAPAAAAEAWRASRPELGPEPDLVLPTFERTVLDNGLVVMAARLDRLPLVAFQLVTRGGAALDPAGAAGLGNMVYGMLDEGAGDLDALAFSDAVADLGASFGAGADRDRGTVSISGLSRHASRLASLLADAVRRPRLAEADFARLKAKTLAGIQARLASPQGLAFLRLPALIYGEDHPLGHPVTGSSASVAGITVEQVRAHHGRLLDPRRSAFVAVGDITLEEAVALARQHLGDWTAPEAGTLDVPPVKATPRERIVFVDKPKSPQTMAVLGRPLFGRGHPDEDALRLANIVFGGSFSSRLNMNLREDKGYTYGAGSQVAFRDGVGVFVAYAALQRAFSAPGVAEFFVELEQLDDEPISAEELDRVKDGFIRGLPGDFQGVSNLAGAAGEIFAYDLPLDHYARLSSRIAATDLDAVRAAADAYLNGEVLAVLLVGDATTVVPALEDLGLGPIEVVPAEPSATP